MKNIITALALAPFTRSDKTFASAKDLHAAGDHIAKEFPRSQFATKWEEGVGSRVQLIATRATSEHETYTAYHAQELLEEHLNVVTRILRADVMEGRVPTQAITPFTDSIRDLNVAIAGKQVEETVLNCDLVAYEKLAADMTTGTPPIGVAYEACTHAANMSSHGWAAVQGKYLTAIQSVSRVSSH